ncbi:MAG: hypothetical protein J6C15_06615 [Bacteroidaceae bacterium]|nr:hypothetical protein [Bacteroidaceae bacterium]MBO5134802.1 hypothetical protein [Bacteroidaceae bacterium]
MKLRIVIYTLLLATLCMGCGNTLSMRELERLEACVNDAPDSVLTVLTAADMPRWGEARALYALLTVQAQDKSGLDVADDSLIRVATRYYDRKGLPLRRLQAFYYHGRVYANAGLSHEAMTAYTRAKEFVDEVDAPYSVGLLYAQMGVLYGNDYDYQRALESMQEALRYYGLAGKVRLQYIAKCDMGLLHLNMLQFSQADSLLNEVLTWSDAHNDTYIKDSTLDLLLRLYDATENIDALDTLISKYPIEKELQTASTYSIIAHYYALKEDKSAAEDALARAWSISATAEDTARLWHKSYQVYKALGAPHAALRNHEQLLTHQDSVVRITLQQPLIASQRDHYETRLKVEELRNQQQRYLMRGAAVIVLMVAVALAIYVRRFLRNKNRQLIEQIELADELRLTIYNKEQALEEVHHELSAQRLTYDTKLYVMDQQISQLFRARYQLLDELSKTYYEGTANKSEKDKVYKKVLTEIERLSVDEEFVQLEDIINEYCDNVMAHIRAELPKMFSKIDYHLLCCFYIGFSGKTISVFTGIEANQIPVYKQRLRSKICKSNAPNKQLMLDKMK